VGLGGATPGGIVGDVTSVLGSVARGGLGGGGGVRGGGVRGGGLGGGGGGTARGLPDTALLGGLALGEVSGEVIDVLVLHLGGGAHEEGGVALREQQQPSKEPRNAQRCRPGSALSSAVRNLCCRARRNTPFEEFANDLARQRALKYSVRANRKKDKNGEDANARGTRECRRGRCGVQAARAHTERVRPARAGVAHDPARGAIIAVC
jgi:hypothetical protein